MPAEQAAPGQAVIAELTVARNEAREEAASLRGQLADAEAIAANWPQCPDGCGCRLGTEDPDGRECGCGGPCTMECRENGYPDAPSYRDLAVKLVTEDLDRLRIGDTALRARLDDLASQWEHGGAIVANGCARELREALEGGGDG